ncbi:AaceriAGL032Cp [[Ashbya] aceris (nom. inval.)]|nr:AaceriAGL032Cp [[Ashbya] aceris (nom. inval.)]
MTTRTVDVKGSMASMSGSSMLATMVPTVGERPFKPCANCNCTPGQLWRQGRRTSQFLRRISNSRKASSPAGSRGGSNESIYSSDSLWQTKLVTTTERLLALRKQMAAEELCCYVIPSEDEHNSEYVGPADLRRQFITGFSGSAGVACVSRDMLNFNTDSPEGKAVLNTDGRYFNQARQELDHNWTLLRQGEDSMTWVDWCVNEAYDMSISLGGKPARIGIDPKLIVDSRVVSIKKQIEEKTKGTNAIVELVPVERNLVDAIWAQFEEPPKRELHPLLLLPPGISGESYQTKRERLMKQLKEGYSGHTAFCVTALDEICWFLNLRGSDVEYNPVFYAYFVIHQDSSVLYTDNPLSEEIEKYLADNNVVVKSYSEIWSDLKELDIKLESAKEAILLPSTASWAITTTVSKASYKLVPSPLEAFKAVKNEVEIRNARTSQVKEAVCLVQFFAWLEEELVQKEKLIDEYKAATKLHEIRKTQKNFVGNSFETISASGSNAAVIHYSPPSEGSAMICPYKIYLCDSGSQFLEGTTDITRTLHFSSPTQEEIDSYTLVLKGNLALERLVFPEGTTGNSIDVIARQFLWEQGLDYRHGTGHGIGSFLNVHEGPIGIGPSVAHAKYPLAKGNIISNEPGFYKDGEFGVRIENDMLVLEAEQLKFGARKFLKFENLTLVPYCRKLINPKLLTPEEKQQLNNYSSKIWSAVAPHLQPQSISYKWLKRETAVYH